MQNNNKGIPVPHNEKQARLMTALADELKKSSHMSMGECMALAGYLAERVVKEGWQWHPVATEENIDFNEIDLGHNRVALTPHQEIDIMDRIIHGLPYGVQSAKLYDVNSLHPQEVVLMDISSPHPVEATNWTRIPEYDNYEINGLGIVRNRWTRRVLEVAEQGGEQYVEMHDKEGFAHDINVRYIKEHVFGN